MKYVFANVVNRDYESPSPRRAWIEILRRELTHESLKSPSPRRAWIEMLTESVLYHSKRVALPTEGVD